MEKIKQNKQFLKNSVFDFSIICLYFFLFVVKGLKYWFPEPALPPAKYTLKLDKRISLMLEHVVSFGRPTDLCLW